MAKENHDTLEYEFDVYRKPLSREDEDVTPTIGTDDIVRPDDLELMVDRPLYVRPRD